MFPLLHGRRWWHFRRFEGLLLSLACMFLLNIIFPGKIYGGTAQACYLPLQLLAGINLYGRLRPGFWAAALTAAGILALHPFQTLSSMPRALQFSLLLLHGLFFFIILLEVFIQLYRAQTHHLHLDARQTLCAGLSGLLLRAEGRVAAFTMGSPIGPDTFDVHFEKAFSDLPGAYPLINREFARWLRERHPGLRWLNREDDMGLEGLRRAKSSYHPDRMVEKSTVELLDAL
mgnify:CR=1 FL=1